MGLDAKILKYQRLLIKMTLKFGEIATFRTHRSGNCDCFNPRFGVYDPMCPTCVGTGNPGGKAPSFSDTRVLAIVTSPDDERFREFSGGQQRQYKKNALFAYEPTNVFIEGYLGWLRSKIFFDSRASGKRYNLVWGKTLPQDEVIELQPGQTSFQIEQVAVYDIDTAILVKHNAGLVNRPLSASQDVVASGQNGGLSLDLADPDDKTLKFDESVTIEEQGLYVLRHWVPYNKISVYDPSFPDVWVGYNVKLDEYFYLDSMHEVPEKGEHYVVKTRNNIEGGVYEAGYWTGLEVTTRWQELAAPPGANK